MRTTVLLLCALLAIAPLGSRATGAPSPALQLAAKLHWRSIGPYIAGRVVAVAGAPGNPDVFYMGSVQGGIWRSSDDGQDWTNVSDGKIPGIADSIGALAVAPSNPKIVYAGTGEPDIRSDVDTGDGLYKTTDAGETWSYAGLRETRVTAKIVVDPNDPNVVYAATLGHVFAPNPDCGVYKTTDGGKTWRKVLFVDNGTGAIDLVMDVHRPSVLYAAMWQAQRYPWKLVSGGPGSGVYKTIDGGAHWAPISSNRGFAAGTLGKIGVAVSPSDPHVVYAIVQAHDGGVFRSTDGGATWQHVNREWKLRQRAFYYMKIFVDPANPNVVYVPEVDGVYKSVDGGKTWNTISPASDNHVLWIDPRHPNVLLEGDDAGATVSIDGGEHWSSENDQPTGQYYHVALDDQFPFHVYGAQQDEGAFEGPSASLGGSIPPGAWHAVALGESTFVAPEPGNPNVTFGSGYFSTFVSLRRDDGEEKNVSPWPRYISGASAMDQKYRFGWTHPVFFSPADPNELLLAAQVVFSSTDRGHTWTIISPDLTRNDPATEGPSGGPVDLDQSGAEIYPDVSALAVSPLDANLLWAGSSDGLVHVTADHGAHWTDVTPPALPKWAEITSIEPSHAGKRIAYLTASCYTSDDYRPYVLKTVDFGAHWTPIVTGLPGDQYVFVVRQDPREPRLLFAGTRSTVYVSFDDGARWQPLTLDLPGVQVRDLAVDAREGELVAATHGRAFWILDNLALLEQLARDPDRLALFAPETAWMTLSYGSGGLGGPNDGENPQYGATVFFNLPPSYDGTTPATLSFVDDRGATIRSFALHLKAKHEPALTYPQRASIDAAQRRARDLARLTGVQPGTNAFQWDLRYPPAYDAPGFHTLGTDDFPDAGDGPTILPGSYTVELRYGESVVRAPLTVRLDPRAQPKPGELEARLALGLSIRDTIDSLDHAVAQANAALPSLPAQRRAALQREIDDLVQFDVHSSEADVLVPVKIREQLGFLLNELDAAYAAPTPAEEHTYRTLAAAAQAGESALHALVAGTGTP